ncbi:hypothetical protein VCUG_00815 [Vavraia culicis subsp. floridensis]|uniref:Ricin B lectin domain-containing protein n=1 Tax=Vavraia culicis (isolate floridensis) TaxID=948595 RepID=L2GWR4_VAVCU|nr:uncharacterized protein VCUG_00815 [Vavraia culicis subsp. floridensis]ELA47733.1 hypothetical protein VCUG_00815 [Vavraia culicis subsp. floridensis]
MFFYLIACYCLDLTQQKWLITPKVNSNAYLQLKDGMIGIIKDVFPLNYDDDRVVSFTAKNPKEYAQKLAKQRKTPTDEPLSEDVSFMINFNEGKMCKLDNFRSLIPCEGSPRERSTWRVNETSNGFKIINGDMCLKVTTVGDNLYTNTLEVELDECMDDLTFYWDIEIMPRNFSLPEDLDEKYEIFVPKHTGINGEEINGHNIFHYGKYNRHVKYD